MYKLPYIPDKSLYAAVMGACSWIRESGYFNKACNYYANKYDVDVEDVKKYVRIAQGNGQKIANARNPRKYHWYALEYSVMSGIDPYFYEPYAAYSVRKATSQKNAEKVIEKKYFQWGNGGDASYVDVYFGRVRQFENENDAKACAKEWEEKNQEKYSNH